jgi:site-specific DNA recombinase
MNERAAIYTRISEKKDAHDSVAVQDRALHRLAESSGYTVVGTYSDDGISAYSGKPRPGWLALKADLRAGKFDVILAVSEDRFARNSEEKIVFQVEAARAKVRWHTISGGRVDPATAGGGLMATITGAIAEYESGNKKERLRQRFDSEIAAGRPLWGVRPFGFENVGGRVGALHEAEAASIREAHRMILEGGTLYGVQQYLNSNGILTSRGNRWSYATVRQMMLRTRNAGVITHHGEAIAGDHPAIVSLEDHHRVVAILTDKSRETVPGPKPLTHFATGLLACGVCGSPMRTAHTGGKTFYKCSRKIAADGHGERHVAIMADIIDARIKSAVLEAFLGGRVTTDRKSGSGTILGRVRAELAELRRRREQAQEIAMLPGADLAHLKGILAEFQTDEARLVTELNELVSQSAADSMLTDLVSRIKVEGEGDSPDLFAAHSGPELGRRWDALAIEHKRELIRGLLRIVVGPGRGTERVIIEQLKPTVAVVAALNSVPLGQSQWWPIAL